MTSADDLPEYTLTSPAFLTVVGVQMLLTLTMGSVNIALPVIQTELEASNAQLTWLVALYQLGFALVLVLGGRLGDMYGTTRVLLIGVTGFAAANTLAMVAPNVEVLLFARLLQGLAGGITTPQVLAVIQRMFSGARRTAAFGAFMTSGALGYVVGQLAAGGLMSADVFGLGWRWSVVFVSPLAVCVLIGAWRVLPTIQPAARESLDVIGFVLAGLTSILVLFPLIQGRSSGWSWWIIAMLASSAPALALFVAHERRCERVGTPPLVRIELFRLRTFAVGNSLGVMVGLISFAIAVFATITLQQGFGLSPFETALVTAPMPLANMVGATVTARLVARVGRSIFVYGAGLLVLSLMTLVAGFAWVSEPIRAVNIVPGLLLFGFSVGIPLAAGVAVTMSDVPTAHAGAASGVQQTTGQLTSSIGIALMGIVFYTVLGTGTEQADYIDAFVAIALVAMVPCVAFALASRLLPPPVQPGVWRQSGRLQRGRSPARALAASPTQDALEFVDE